MAGYTQLKLVIIEDEWVICRYIRSIIESHFPAVVVCDECRNVDEAITSIEKHTPEIVLLDIELGDGTCFDVLNKVQHLSFQKIFITSYSEYALQAIKIHAVDYHLKPINEKDLVKSIARCIETIEHNEIIKLSTLRSKALNTQKKEEENFLVINKKTEKVLIDYSKILYVLSSNSYTTVFFLNKKNVDSIKTSISIKHMEENLPAKFFFRIHNRYIINTNYFSHIEGSSAKLEYNISVPVNPEKAKLLKTRLV